MMFTRSCLRPLQAATKTCLRTYATKPANPQAAKKLPLYGLAASAAAVAGYTLLTGVAADGARNPGGPGAPPSSGEESNVPRKAGDRSVKCFTGGDQGWVSLKLESAERINSNTKRLRFHLPEEDSVSGLDVASALLTKYQGPHDAKPIIRPYTPVSDEDTAGFLDLIVKQYPDGPMSTHLNEMEPNQRIEMKGPIPKYNWSANKHDHIALIAGGTGITPMYQLCRAIFKNPADKTKVTLVFGNVTEQDILLKREFEDLEQQFPNRFRAFYTLDQPPKSWTAGSPGHINKDLLQTVLPKSSEENLKIFVCGPPGLYKAISGAKKSPKDQGDLTGLLAELGYSKDQVYKF